MKVLHGSHIQQWIDLQNAVTNFEIHLVKKFLISLTLGSVPTVTAICCLQYQHCTTTSLLLSRLECCLKFSECHGCLQQLYHRYLLIFLKPKCLKHVVSRLLANFRIEKNWPSIEKFGITHVEENYSSNQKSQIIGNAHPSTLQGIKLCRHLFLIIKERFEASSVIESMKAMKQATPGSGVQVLVLGVHMLKIAKYLVFLMYLVQYHHGTVRLPVVVQYSRSIVLNMHQMDAYVGNMHCQVICRCAYSQNMHSHDIPQYAYFPNMHSHANWKYAYS